MVKKKNRIDTVGTFLRQRCKVSVYVGEGPGRYRLETVAVRRTNVAPFYRSSAREERSKVRATIERKSPGVAKIAREYSIVESEPLTTDRAQL